MVGEKHPHELSLTEAVSRFLTDFQAHYDRMKTLKSNRDVPITDVAPEVWQLERVYLREIGQSPEVPRKAYERKPSNYANTGSGHGYCETHESFGMVSFARVSGHRKFFGSAVKHQHYICLRILRGARESTEFGEYFRATPQAPIVEVALTAAQFAETITTMNMGDGVPCTITNIEGVHMDEPPNMQSELVDIRDQFAQRIEDMKSTASNRRTQIRALINKKSLTTADRETLLKYIDEWYRFLDDSAPFLLKLFQEKTEKTIARAKTEIESFMNLVMHRIGVKAIKDSNGMLELPTQTVEVKSKCSGCGTNLPHENKNDRSWAKGGAPIDCLDEEDRYWRWRSQK